jgi:PD-(D/E)XK nuclease superfamily
MLARLHAHSLDVRITFCKAMHTYTIDGNVVVRATPSRIASLCFSAFDANNVITKNMEKWRLNSASRYHKIVESCDKTGINPEVFIRELWRISGAIASSRGTLLHRAIEMHLNNEESHDFDSSIADDDDKKKDSAFCGIIAPVLRDAGYDEDTINILYYHFSESASSLSQIDRIVHACSANGAKKYMESWKQTWWSCRSKTLIPIRTEWSVFGKVAAKNGGNDYHYVAGQIDAVFEEIDDDDNKSIVIVDWKTTTSGKSLDDSYNNKQFATHPAISNLPDTKISRFRVQISIYAWILRNFYYCSAGSPVVIKGVIVQIDDNDSITEHTINLLSDAVVEKIVLSLV